MSKQHGGGGNKESIALLKLPRQFTVFPWYFTSEKSTQIVFIHKALSVQSIHLAKETEQSRLLIGQFPWTLLSKKFLPSHTKATLCSYANLCSSVMFAEEESQIDSATSISENSHYYTEQTNSAWGWSRRPSAQSQWLCSWREILKLAAASAVFTISHVLLWVCTHRHFPMHVFLYKKEQWWILWNPLK